MLRFALLVLLLANAGYLAWTQGWMATLGWAPAVQTESYRLQQQVRPDVLSIAPQVAEPINAPRTPEVQPEALVTTVSEPTEEVLPESTICLQSDSMDEAKSSALQRSLQGSALPASSWQLQTSSVSGRWMVYLGKFPNDTALEKRRADLRARKIAYDRAGGNLEPGLSLGRFSSEEAAARELSRMLNQGVRGARVVQERTPQTLYTLRVEQATAAQHNQLRSMLPALGITLRACPGS